MPVWEIQGQPEAKLGLHIRWKVSWTCTGQATYVLFSFWVYKHGFALLINEHLKSTCVSQLPFCRSFLIERKKTTMKLTRSRRELKGWALRSVWTARLRRPIVCRSRTNWRPSSTRWTGWPLTWIVPGVKVYISAKTLRTRERSEYKAINVAVLLAVNTFEVLILVIMLLIVHGSSSLKSQLKISAHNFFITAGS